MAWLQQLSIVKLYQLRSQPKDKTAPGASVALGGTATSSGAVKVALRVQQQIIVGKCAIPPDTGEGVKQGLLAGLVHLEHCSVAGPLR